MAIVESFTVRGGGGVLAKFGVEINGPLIPLYISLYGREREASLLMMET